MQQKMVTVKIQLQLRLTADERWQPVSTQVLTAPHFQVSAGEYLGVILCNCRADAVAPRAPACPDVVLIYEPDANYSALTPAVEFNVLEGRQVVGTGIEIA